MSESEHESGNEKVTVGTKVEQDVKRELARLAIELSEPGDRVTPSEILRGITRDALGFPTEFDIEGEDETVEMEA